MANPLFARKPLSLLIAESEEAGSHSLKRTLGPFQLTALGVGGETIQLLSKYVPPERVDVVRSFGESLPPGLQFVSSPNCLLSLPAFHSPGPTFSKSA